jgi:hypothetical protein
MRILLSLFVCSLTLSAADPDRYTAEAATTAYTIQAPANNGRSIVFGTETSAGASVYCSSNQTVTLAWNGAAATATTSATEVKLPGTQQPSGMTFWTASNVGGGTTGPTYHVLAGNTLLLYLFPIRLARNGTANNLTISATGSCTITFYYSAT